MVPFFRPDPSPAHVTPRRQPARHKAADGEKDLLEICFSLRLVLALEGVESLDEMMDDWSSEETDDPVHEPRNAENVWKNLTTTT